MKLKIGNESIDINQKSKYLNFPEKLNYYAKTYIFPRVSCSSPKFLRVQNWIFDGSFSYIFILD